MNRRLRGVGLGGAIIVLGVLSSGSAYAASPSPHSSCTAQFNQAGTPHGFAQMPPGFVGQFTSSEATTNPPRYVGDGSSTFARQHGGLVTCLLQPA
jgi:hypothetical protein